METFKDFFACRIALDANHQYPKIVQRLFHRQKTLSLKSSTTWKHSKTFSPAELSRTQIINIPKLFKDFFSPAELSQPQINDTLKLFKDFFTGRKLLVSNHQQHGNIQRLFRLQNCLGRKSSISQIYSKTFSPAELSQPQINDTLKLFKDFFTGRKLLVSNHQQHGNIQRLFRLQNCLGRKSSISQNYSKTFSPAELSQPQINDTLKLFKDFFTGRIILAANHQQHGNNQTPFHLQNCLGRKSSISQSYSKTFFRLQNCLSRKSTIP